MNIHADKTQENKSQSISAVSSPVQNSGESTFRFVDNRPEAIAQRRLQEMANNSPQVSQLRAFQDMANNSPQAKQTAQMQSLRDNSSLQKQQPIQKKKNNTGLPDNLKTGMENLSSMSLDDVKVHYNSDKPAQLQAYPYAQGIASRTLNHGSIAKKSLQAKWTEQHPEIRIDEDRARMFWEPDPETKEEAIPRGWWLVKKKAKEDVTERILHIPDPGNTNYGQQINNYVGVELPAWAGSKAKEEFAKKQSVEAYMKTEQPSDWMSTHAYPRGQEFEASMDRISKSNREDLALKLLGPESLMKVVEYRQRLRKTKESGADNKALSRRPQAEKLETDPQIPNPIIIDPGSEKNYFVSKPGQTLTGVMRLTNEVGGEATIYLYPNQVVEDYGPFGYKPYPAKAKSAPAKAKSAPAKAESKNEKIVEMPSIGEMTIEELIKQLKKDGWATDAYEIEKLAAQPGAAIQHTGKAASHEQLVNLIAALECVKSGEKAPEYDEDFDTPPPIIDNELQETGMTVGFTVIRGGDLMADKYAFTSASSNNQVFKSNTGTVPPLWEVAIRGSIEALSSKRSKILAKSGEAFNEEAKENE